MPNNDVKEFQSRLSYERTIRGITQTELARTLEMSQAHLSYIEHGKRDLTIERYYQILEYFNFRDERSMYHE